MEFILNSNEVFLVEILAKHESGFDFFLNVEAEKNGKIEQTILKRFTILDSEQLNQMKFPRIF